MSRPVPPVGRQGAPILPLAWLAVSAALSLSLANQLVEVDTSGGSVNITLPLASSVPPGTPFFIAQTSTSNSVVLVRSGADTINGVGANFTFSTNGVLSAMVYSNGTTGWRLICASSNAAASALQTRSANATILAGTSAITTADLGLGALNGAGTRIIASIRQAALDVTLTTIVAVGNAGGTVTIQGNANATANVVVSVFVDIRT